MFRLKAASAVTFGLFIAAPSSVFAQSAPTPGTTGSDAAPPPLPAPATSTAPAAPLPPRPEVEHEDIRGVLQFLAGGAVFDVSKLNDRLHDAGYGKIAPTALVIGGTSHAAVLDGKLLLGGTGAFFLSNTTEGRADLSAQYTGGWGGFDIGWQLVDSPHFALAGLLTLGGFGLDVNIRQSRNVDFDTALKTPNTDTTLHESGGLVGLSIPFEVRIPLHEAEGRTKGFVVGLRPGFLYGIKFGDWKSANATETNGPNLGLAGGYLALSIGGADW